MVPVLYEFPEDIANDRGSPPAWQDPKDWWMVTPMPALSQRATPSLSQNKPQVQQRSTR